MLYSQQGTHAQGDKHERAAVASWLAGGSKKAGSKEFYRGSVSVEPTSVEEAHARSLDVWQRAVSVCACVTRASCR